MAFLNNEDLIRNVVSKTTVPLVFRGFIQDWPLCQWTLKKWSSAFGEKQVPFRCMKKNFVSDSPCWERMCNEKPMTLKDFIENTRTSQEWMYFDYKYIQQWFNSDHELCKVN